MSSASQIAGLVAGAVAALSATWARSADAAHPTVIELFQSQGCSSCPPANANVMALGGRPDILALSFQVTYWDQLGWKDTFGAPEYTARQWAYARGLRHDNVFTPQVVINGRTDVVGVRPGEIERAVVRADRGAGGPRIMFVAGRVMIGAAPASAPADVWLVRYDPRVIEVPIRRGENGGRTLPHKNIVRSLIRLGAWSGPARDFDLPLDHDPGLNTAILLQAARGGPILAAARS